MFQGPSKVTSSVSLISGASGRVGGEHAGGRELGGPALAGGHRPAGALDLPVAGCAANLEGALGDADHGGGAGGGGGHGPAGGGDGTPLAPARPRRGGRGP